MSTFAIFAIRKMSVPNFCNYSQRNALEFSKNAAFHGGSTCKSIGL